MSRFYRDLHDRELLAQAASVLHEAQQRKLIDVFLPPDARAPDEDPAVFPRRLAGIGIRDGRLLLSVEPRFFQNFNGLNG